MKFLEGSRLQHSTKTIPGLVQGELISIVGLKYISISCNIVDSSQNLDTQGGKSNILTSLAIPTSQSLFGSTQHFSDIESKVMVDKGIINQITFKVTDQDGNPVNVGEILLECYIM